MKSIISLVVVTLLICLVSLSFSETYNCTGKTNLNLIVVQTPPVGEDKILYSKGYIPALEIALNEINNNEDILQSFCINLEPIIMSEVRIHGNFI